MPASGPSTPILFLHGCWHGSWWRAEVLVQVAGAGARALAVDMAGHGLRARRTADPGRTLAPCLVAHAVYLTVFMPAFGVLVA